MNHSVLALLAGLFLSIVGAFSGFGDAHTSGHDHVAGHDHAAHSPVFERQLDRNALNLELSTEEVETPQAFTAEGDEEIIIWNPISGSLSSGCTLSGCLGSGCGGSGCAGSGCLGSGCGSSGCLGSACGGSACGGSACGLSGCVGSACGLSGCVGSLCTQSGCVGSACLVSGCKVSICIVSGCKDSYCVGSLCKNSFCVGSVACKKNCIAEAKKAFAQNPEYGQEYSWWVAYGRGVNPGGWVPYLYLDPVTAEAWEMPKDSYTLPTEDQLVYVSQTTGKVLAKDELHLIDEGDYVYLDEATGEFSVAIEVAPFFVQTVNPDGEPVELAVYENPLTHEFFDPATGKNIELSKSLVARYTEAYGQGKSPKVEPTVASEPVPASK